MIKENLQNIKSNLQENVTLVAVSKTKPNQAIMEAYATGHRIFGENKVQEMTQKWEELPRDIQWHMIGHLQTNKVKYIIDKVSLIHSVDSVKLAQEISKRAKSIDKEMEILLQVNVSNEASKFGIDKEDVTEIVDEIGKMENIRLKGLMTIAPFGEKPEVLRKYFRELREIFENIKYNNKYTNVEMEHLSMGMTNDFEIAIEEGATLLRIGTGIYGRRHYDK